MSAGEKINRKLSSNMFCYDMRVELLKALGCQLAKLSDKSASRKIANLANVIAGEKVIVNNKEDFFAYLEGTNITNVNIDSPKGSKKGFGGKKRVLPFDYGEAVGIINPADDMGWDVIFPPSQKPDGGKLVPIGIVAVNDDVHVWKENANKLPPIGNDKIIVSNDGKISKDDKKIISDFFDGMWQFKKIKWI